MSMENKLGELDRPPPSANYSIMVTTSPNRLCKYRFPPFPVAAVLILGIDSLNCPLGGIVTVAACGYGSTPLGLFTVLIPCVTMFLSSWEQYHTGTLYLGYFNGPCEGIIIACTIMSISAIYGPGFYHQKAADRVGWPFQDSSLMVYDLLVGMCLLAFSAVHMPAW